MGFLGLFKRLKRKPSASNPLTHWDETVRVSAWSALFEKVRGWAPLDAKSAAVRTALQVAQRPNEAFALCLNEAIALCLRDFLDNCIWSGFGEMRDCTSNSTHLDPDILRALAINETDIAVVVTDSCSPHLRHTAQHVLRVLEVARERRIIERNVDSSSNSPNRVKDSTDDAYITGQMRTFKYSGQPEGKRFEFGEVKARSREEARAKLESLNIHIRTLHEKSN